jgi:hypothetical protein
MQEAVPSGGHASSESIDVRLSVGGRDDAPVNWRIIADALIEFESEILGG